MDDRTALAALKMDMLGTVIFLARRLIDKAFGNRRLMLHEGAAFRHFFKLPVYRRLVHGDTMLLQERRQFSGSKTAFNLRLNELGNEIRRLRVI